MARLDELQATALAEKFYTASGISKCLARVQKVAPLRRWRRMEAIATFS